MGLIYFLSEAFEKISEDSKRIQKEDWPRLIDLLLTELDSDDQVQLMARIEEIPGN